MGDSVALELIHTSGSYAGEEKTISPQWTSLAAKTNDAITDAIDDPPILPRPPALRRWAVSQTERQVPAMVIWPSSIQQAPARATTPAGAVGFRRATRPSAWRGLLAWIGPAVLDIGEHLRSPLSPVSAITCVCERLATWAESDGRRRLDSDRSRDETSPAVGGKATPNRGLRHG